MPRATPERKSSPPAGDTRQGVESIETGGRLLQALAAASRPMMLRDLALAAEMPPAKAHRYLVSFMRLGLVEQLSDGGRYDIGPFAIQLGLAGLGRLDPLRIAEQELEALRDRLGHTVALAVAGSHGPTIVRWLDSMAPVSASLRAGSVMPLTRSATGRVFLAFDAGATAPGGRWATMLADELAQNAQRRVTPVDADGVRKLVDSCRQRGMARVTGELSPGIHSVSAPVFDAQHRLALAVTALGYEGLFDAGWDADPARALRECARRIGVRLGAEGR